MAIQMSGGGVKAEPNVTPMIDVMLVLLIIFMIIVPALNAGFKAQPPNGKNLKAHPEDNTDVVLGIDVNGAVLPEQEADSQTRICPTQLKQIYAMRARKTRSCT